MHKGLTGKMGRPERKIMIRNQKTKRIIAGIIAGILVVAMVAGTIIGALVSIL